MAKATPKAKDSRTGEGMKKTKKHRTITENSAGLKIKPFKKWGEIWKYKENPSNTKPHFWQLVYREHCIQRSQWGYEETTEDRQKPQTFKSFLQPQDCERFYTKEPRQEEFYVIGTKYLAVFSTKHQNKQTKKNLNEGPSEFSNLYLEITTLISFPLSFLISK